MTKQSLWSRFVTGEDGTEETVSPLAAVCIVLFFGWALWNIAAIQRPVPPPSQFEQVVKAPPSTGIFWDRVNEKCYSYATGSYGSGSIIPLESSACGK